MTGGGPGIGRGIVDRFLAEGARVAILQRRPDDVGELAVLLASDRSSFLTRETIVLAGGRTAMLPTPR